MASGSGNRWVGEKVGGTIGFITPGLGSMGGSVHTGGKTHIGIVGK